MQPTKNDQEPGSCGFGPADPRWTDGVVHTELGDVPRLKTSLGVADRLGTLKARLAMGRMDYRVAPGLYAVGSPGPEAPVLVSANYKLSFDCLRGVLAGRDAWILVLDTKGVNVWCAAGKGTFGTEELVRRVERCALGRLVSHRKLVVPQLGAPGVSAPAVKKGCGFRVEYGPVRALDLPAFLDARMQASPDMRRVRFGLRERLVLVPAELVLGGKTVLLVAAALVLVGGLGPSGYSLAGVRTHGLVAAALVLGAFAGAAIFGLALLPRLPGRAFSVKGAALGLVMAAALAVIWWPGLGEPYAWLLAALWVLAIPALVSFVLMNFTGSSTFTSLSGVQREMRLALPAQISAAALGLASWLVGLFLTGGH
jgi:hypothetical protein